MSYYIYIIKSSSGRRYIGYTNNLKQRLSQHNRRHHGSTNRIYETWSIEGYLEVTDKNTAMDIEAHLKSMKNSRKALRYIEARKCQG